MKELSFYKGLPQEQVFHNFLSSLQRSITGWDYFVDWEKVKGQVKIYNTELNILNSIIGSSNIEEDFISICKQYPEVKQCLPILIAVRTKQLKDLPLLLDPHSLEVSEIKEYFQETNSDYDNLLRFFVESGLKDVFLDKRIKNLIDYVTGIEVGMDTNGRKNRTGKIMENLVEQEVKKICIKGGFEYDTQMTVQEIKDKWGVVVPTDKSQRRFDIVIYNGTEVLPIEVNFYRGGGTKLKSTAGEYMSLGELLKNSNIKFVWITDGLGWLTAHKPLEEAYIKNDYIFNLKMIKRGVLEEII
jgi:type II restriction enzyme